MLKVTVVAVDVGSLSNIAWWRATPSGVCTSGRDLDSLVDTAVSDLLGGASVALGFEAPLFIPRPGVSLGLNRQRVGERGRPWCAGAGTGALALGIQQAAYIFESLAKRVRPRVTFSTRALTDGDAELLIWEAFVSGASKNRGAEDPHVDDARIAVVEFQRRLRAGELTSDVDEPTVLNLAAAGLIASGLTSRVELLKEPCIVVKPAAYGGAA